MSFYLFAPSLKRENRAYKEQTEARVLRDSPVKSFPFLSQDRRAFSQLHVALSSHTLPQSGRAAKTSVEKKLYGDNKFNLG